MISLRINMKNMNRILILLFFCLGLVTIQAQEFNIGIRAGLNYSKLNGPVEGSGEAIEKLGFGGGFHFGVSYQRNFTSLIGLRTEFLYIQNGGTRSYSGPSYFVLRAGDETVFDRGILEGTDTGGNNQRDGYFLEVSNAYISFPVTLHIKPSRKFEFLAGAYVGFSVGPRANGRVQYQSTDAPDDIFFSQGLRYDYYGDIAGEGNFNAGSTAVFVQTSEGEKTVVVPSIAGAYYQLAEKEDNTYKTLDYGLIAGANYFFNSGFYFGSRLTYGLRDLTNNAMDFSLIDFNSDKTLITRDDVDKHLGLEFSLGFKF